MNHRFSLAQAALRSSPVFSFILKTAAVAVLSTVSIGSALATDWFVDGKYGSNASNGSSYTPFQTVQHAWYKASAGDTIHLKPTTVYGYLYLGGKSGYAGKPITLQGDGTTTLTQVSGGGKGYGIMVDGANYVTLKNLNITAPGAGSSAGWSGVLVKKAHHVQIVGNAVHDAGCSGIQTESADYVTIDKNRVYGNAKVVKNNVYCSGISVHENLDIDANTGTKMIISNNLIYGNTNVRVCSTCTNSDGSGIIIDDSRRTQTDYRAYKGGHLVENNVIFNNGGRGVHVFISDNVVIRSNTMYYNNRDSAEGGWRPGEISGVNSGGMSIYNNILYSAGSAGTSVTGQHVGISIQSSTGAAHNIGYNLIYNAVGNASFQTYFRSNAVAVNYDSTNRWGNPAFRSPSLDGTVADFRPTVGGYAQNFSSPSWSYPSWDLMGIWRANPVTAGAYQNAL